MFMKINWKSTSVNIRSGNNKENINILNLFRKKAKEIGEDQIGFLKKCLYAYINKEKQEKEMAELKLKLEGIKNILGYEI